MIKRDWHKCYNEGWKGVIVDDAFCHPAKFARGLIRRIYDHAFGMGWLVEGDTVADPFGGVALGALQAMRHGLHWVGCELEPRFVDLGGRNIDLWNDTYSGRLPTWGTARLVQGDSRELGRVIAATGGVVSSPPFESSLSNKPSNQILAGSGGRMGQSCKSDDYYGATPGQLAQESTATFWEAARAIVAQTYAILRPGSVAIWVTKAFVRKGKRVDFPGQWLQLCQSCGFEPLEWVRAWLVEDNGTQAAMFGEDKRLVKERKSFFRRLAEKKGSPPIDYEVVVIVRKPQGDGRGVGAVVSSPPYAEAQAHPSIGSVNKDDWGSEGKDITARRGLSADYGHTPGQLGAMKPGEIAAALAPFTADAPEG